MDSGDEMKIGKLLAFKSKVDLDACYCYETERFLTSNILLNILLSSSHILHVDVFLNAILSGTASGGSVGKVPDC